MHAVHLNYIKNARDLSTIYSFDLFIRLEFFMKFIYVFPV